MLETLTDWLSAPAAERERGLRAVIGRIRELDPSIQAWAHVEPQPATGGGALDGIPFAAKDVFETSGLPTEYGSPLYRGRIAIEDAAIVRDLRGRGAVLIGKTHTAAFAHRTPAPTRNPRNLEHTPGGSSSGSAAAVAAGMVPIALGTQTKGSILRPASYCGVTGFKPTFGRLALDGVLPLAPSLDTPGFFTHTPADMLALWKIVSGQLPGVGPELQPAVPVTDNWQPTTVGVVDPLPDVDPVMADAFCEAVATLRGSGISIRRVDIAGMLRTLCEANDAVMHYEGARVHRERYAQFGPRLGDLAHLVRRGMLVSRQKYEAAKRLVEACREKCAAVFNQAPILLLPAATGPAPAGLASTGDASMNTPWTTLGAPAVSVPLPVRDMPLGLQLVAAHGQDAGLLQAAVYLYQRLGTRVGVAAR